MTHQLNAAPPGWYPDQTGHLRWWDGARWGLYAPPRSPTDSGKAFAVVSHVGMFAGGFVLPLVIYLTEGKKDEFVRHHSREALNFQITFLAVWILAMGGFFLSFLLSVGADDDFGFFFPFPPLFPVLLMVQAASMALAILGAVRASQDQWWRYPLSIRFVKGSPAP